MGYDFTQKMNKENVLTLKEVSEFPILPITDEQGGVNRGITKDTCEFLGIRTWVDTGSGEPYAHCFPVTKKEAITGYIICKINPTNKKDKWSVVGDVSVENDLIGQANCGNGNKLFIAEGMYDWASCYQVLKKFGNDRYKNLISVVTIGFGTRNAVDHIRNNTNFISKYKEVITVFDNDEATEEQRKKGIMKGREATSAVHLFLGGEGCYAALAQDCDPNDYLQDGEDEELFWCMMKPERWQHSKVIMGCPVTLEEINTPIKQGFNIDFLPRFSRMLGSFRPHEMTILLAPPKSGKSTLAKQIYWAAKRDGVNVCGAFLEETLKKTAQSLIALEADVDLATFRRNPSMISNDIKQKCMDTLMDDRHLLITSEKGIITPDEAIQLVKFAASRMGADGGLIVFDHLSYVMSGSNMSNERQAIDHLLTELEGIKKKYPVHILAIAHVTIDKNRGKRKDADGNIVYPYWYEVEEHDGRGSSAYAQLCDNLVAIDKEHTADGSRGHTWIKILLNREEDKTGKCDILTKSYSSGRLMAVGD